MGFFTSSKAAKITADNKKQAKERGAKKAAKETGRTVKGYNKPNPRKPLNGGWV